MSKEFTPQQQRLGIVEVYTEAVVALEDLGPPFNGSRFFRMVNNDLREARQGAEEIGVSQEEIKEAISRGRKRQRNWISQNL